MPQPACILIADDDPEIRIMVKVVVEKAGYRTVLVENGFQAVQAVRTSSLDLLVMDVMMPGMDGFEACRQIRAFSDLPIILLTVRSEEDDLVNGLTAGAFDYLTKPFRPRELVARIQTQLQRSRAHNPDRPVEQSRTLVYADLSLDLRNREVLLGGQRLNITVMGYHLLEYFLNRIGEVISKDQLQREVWDYPDTVDGKNMIEAAIKRLRKELGDDSRDPRYIKTVWGVGYKFGEKPVHRPSER